MSAGYEKAIARCPQPQVASTRSMWCASGSRAIDQVRRDEYNAHGRSATGHGTWIKGTRCAC